MKEGFRPVLQITITKSCIVVKFVIQRLQEGVFEKGEVRTSPNRRLRAESDYHHSPNHGNRLLLNSRF